MGVPQTLGHFLWGPWGREGVHVAGGPWLKVKTLSLAAVEAGSQANPFGAPPGVLSVASASPLRALWQGGDGGGGSAPPPAPAPLSPGRSPGFEAELPLPVLLISARGGE